LKVDELERDESIMTKANRSTTGQGWQRLGRMLALSLVTVSLGACDFAEELLEQKAPSRIDAEVLNGPQNARLLVTSAIGDFECAWGAHVFMTGLIADEIADGQLGSAQWPHDRRDFQSNDNYGTAGCANTQGIGLYVPIATARWTADDILEKLEGWTDAEVTKRDSLIAVSSAYAGYGYVVLGEDFCTAAVDLGPEMQPAEVLTIAEQRFTTAIDAATRANATQIRSLALVGRARTRLKLGNKTGAAADARLVPAGFVYTASASDINLRRHNRVATAISSSRLYTIEPVSRALMTEGVIDPRTRVNDTGVRASDGTNVFAAAKYPSVSTPIPIARYQEAQLIIAEAEGGQTAINIVNALRQAAGLPNYSGTTATIASWLPEERRRELFLEGHRLHDIIRFNLPLNPPAGTAFPLKGGFYGNQRCMPLPDLERLNNPSISG
jgi:hypothetical protein